MNQPPNMVTMNSQGGPVGGTPLMNNGGTPLANNGGVRGPADPQTLLNTYIYDYFLKNHHWDLARQVKNELHPNTKPGSGLKPSPGRRDVNGVDDAMDTDSKDDLHKCPDDLPQAAVPSDATENSFLFDWWSQFWDIFNAHRQRQPGTRASFQYLQHQRQQAHMRHENQQRILMTNNPARPYQNMMGVPPNLAEMQKRAMHGRGPMSAQQFQQMKNQQMMQNQQMQRDGSQMDMNNRPQSPGSAENAPSPNKRPRLDNNGINSQPMAPGARTQGMQPQQMGATAATAAQTNQMLIANGMDPNNMTAQQFTAFQGQTPNVQAKNLQVYSQNLALQYKAALNNTQLAKDMNNAGMQNSPMGQQSAENQDFFPSGQPRVQAVPPGQQAGGNHALQDYQMQLMLLEQQNKKRLLMARQEQDNITQHPGQGPVGQPGFPPAMSPQGSRAGPSPNPNEQMKRGTPKLGQAGLPGSPMPDGSMPQNRSSPMPNGFEQGQLPPGMPPHFYPQQMGANGMMRPPSSHPGFPPGGQQMTPQQMEMFQRSGGRMQNGIWQGPPQMMQAQQPGQQQQQQQQQQPQPGGGPQPNQQQPPPMGTPQQRSQQMPPPPAPTQGTENGRTQPSSPATQPNPPTPSQANKPNPKKAKKADEKKPAPQKAQPAKKGSTTGATPASEAEPPTPTPTAQQPPNQPPQQQPAAPANASAPMAQTVDLGSQFDALGAGGEMNLDFAGLDHSDVLESFDFDNFLQNNDESGPFFDNGFNLEGDNDGGL
ncbi:camp-dependent protein kinase pathway protein [Phyllosticta capitalensis]